MNINSRIFTVDVEEYYHAENILYSLTEGEIKSLPDRLDIGLSKILDLLGERHKATFFVLGCVAERNKDLIKRISKSGHEIASHGYQHKPLNRYNPKTFEDDLDKSVRILSDLTGQRIIGYRATGFSLSKETPWLFDILQKHKIIYDSSLSFSLFRHCWDNIIKMQDYPKIGMGVLEFPTSFIRIGPIKIPLGGGYFRAFPYRFIRRGLDRASCNKNIPAIFYIHPWELDLKQPRCKISPLKYFRHYFGLGTTEKKLKRLLADMRFTSIEDFYKKMCVSVNFSFFSFLLFSLRYILYNIL